MVNHNSKKSMSFNRLLPNILTVLALCSGLTAIRFALNEKWEEAVISLVIACFLDGIDGLVARILRGATKFGAELDSLSDAVSFGVVPSILVYLWAMNTAGTIGWALSLFYTVCCILRLARFNTMEVDPSVPGWSKNYFVGVPSPAAAGLIILPLIYSFYFEAGIFNNPTIVGFFLIIVSLLMVSRVPTFSIKRSRIPNKLVLPLMLLVALLTVFLVTDTWATLGLLGLLYIISIPFSCISFYNSAKKSTE